MEVGASMALLLGVTASFFFGIQAVLGKRSMAYVDPQSGAMIAIGMALLVFWALAPFQMTLEQWRSPGLWIFAGNGLIHPTLSLYLAFEAAKRMGATTSATISATAPLFATVGAVLALGEQLTVLVGLGTLGTVLGIVALSWRGGNAATWALSALWIPIGAAMVRGANHVIGRYGLEILPSAHFAATVSFTVSFVLQVLIYRARHGRLPLNLPPRGLLLGAGSGLALAVAILCMYGALGSGLVVIVSPVVATYPLFTLFIAVAIGEERFSRRVALGVVLVVGGVILISLA